MDELVVNVMNTPVEAMETEFPVRVERYELAADSGGPGTFRGGLGTRREWRVLADETIVNLRMDRFKFSSRGCSAPSRRMPRRRCSIRAAPSERALTSKVAGLRLKKDDLLSVESPAAAAGASRSKRDPARVREDVVRGYVSLAGGRRTTTASCSIPATSTIDADATARLRADRSALMTLRVGIDVGGTFTDVTAFDEAQGELVAVRKYTSNPADPPPSWRSITRDLGDALRRGLGVADPARLDRRAQHDARRQGRRASAC